MNVEQRQMAADPQTVPTYVDGKFACTPLSSTPASAIHNYCSDRKLVGLHIFQSNCIDLGVAGRA